MKMKLKQWVVFIDILGYGEVTNKIKNSKDADDFIAFMKSNQEILTNQSSESVKKSYKADRVFNLYEYYEIEVAFVSDSLIINYKPIEFENSKITEEIATTHSANSLIIILMRLQSFIFNCLKSENKLLIRGGISDKYCKIVENFAVGEGVIEAYKLESKVANFPRIVISESIIQNEKLMEKQKLISKLIYKIDSFITNDENDNISYLDYLKYHIGTTKHPGMNILGTSAIQYLFFDTHKKVIEEKISNITEDIKNCENPKIKKKLEGVLLKFNWLKNYHNNTLKDFDEKLVIE